MQIPNPTASPRNPPVKAATPTDRESLMIQARALEAAFLSEMLGQAGVGAARDSFGGGIGEEQFASFLRDEQAKLMVQKGGIGLAEKLFRSMSGGQDVA